MAIKECCQQEENLYIFERTYMAKIKSEPGPEDIIEHEKTLYEVHPIKTVRKCKICGCRHIEMEADPGELGVIGKEM